MQPLLLLIYHHPGIRAQTGIDVSRLHRWIKFNRFWSSNQSEKSTPPVKCRTLAAATHQGKGLCLLRHFSVAVLSLQVSRLAPVTIWFCRPTNSRRHEDESWPKAKGWETTVSLETPEAAIDPKGGKADGISLTWGKLHRVTQADQCLSQPPLPLSLPPSLGDVRRLTLAPQFWETEGRRAAEKKKKERKTGKKNPKNHRQMCERRCGFLSVFWSGRVKDGELRFQLPRVPPATSQGMYEIKRSCDVEDPQMPRLLSTRPKRKERLRRRLLTRRLLCPVTKVICSRVSDLTPLVRFFFLSLALFFGGGKLHVGDHQGASKSESRASS